MIRSLCLSLGLLTFVMTIAAQQRQSFFPADQLVSTGIYYYPEHWPEAQWERDIKHIAELGFEFVHLAEFAWYKMEPEEGQYNFDWLDKVMALCRQYKLKVLLCTPSATPPAWMRIRYPDTYIMNGNYIRAENGTRGLTSMVSEQYKKFVAGVLAELGRRYGHDEQVMGWQIDNEPGASPDYSPLAQDAFREWLKRKYGSIDSLNAAWGNAFWSQWFASFEQVMIPNTNIVGWWGNNPHALLDFKRYSADAQAAFLDFQADILRKHIAAGQFITTNYTAVSTGSDAMRTSKLDFATYTAYPNSGQSNLGELGFRLGNHRLILFAASYYKQVGGETGILEIQPGPVNWGNYNPLLLPGTVRMWLYHSFAAGAKLECSYRFRQINYGAEQYHAGILKTDAVTLAAGGEEYVQFMKEIRLLRKEGQPGSTQPEKLKTRATAILWNLENFWSIDRQRQTYQWDSWGYPLKFLELAKSMGAPAEIIGEQEDFSKYRFLIVPAYEMMDSSLLQKLTAFAENGGQLILTCRTGTKDRNGHFWAGGNSAVLTPLIGAQVTATDMLSAQRNAEIVMEGHVYHWNNWADILQPTDKKTSVLATYSSEFYKGAPAVVQSRRGKGTVTYIAVDTDEAELEKDVLKKIYAEGGATIEDYPPGLFVYWRDGMYIAVNYSSAAFSMPLPANARKVIGEKNIQPAGVLVWKE